MRLHNENMSPKTRKKVEAMYDEEDIIVSLLSPHACACIRMTRASTHRTHMYTKNKVDKEYRKNKDYSG